MATSFNVWLMFTTRSDLHMVLFLELSVTFCWCMKYLRNRWTDLRQIHREDVFGPSLGRVWMSWSKIKVIRDKKLHFSDLSAACMQFMLG